MNILAIVTARGGSKSIPGKNIIPFLGKPLIAWSVEAARAAERVDRVITSTDSPEIADAARRAGSEVPFMRPPSIAQDDTLDLPVFVHALNWLAEHESYRPEIVVHLRPTTPLRPSGLIDRGIDLLNGDSQADSVRAVCCPHNNPFKMWTITPEGAMRPLIEIDVHEPYNQPRQKLPRAFWQTGALDVSRWSTIMEKHSMTGDRILPLEIDNKLAVDIDDEMSLQHATLVCTQYGLAG